MIALETQWGYDAFQWVGDRVTEFLHYSQTGSIFVFGKVFAEHEFAFGVSANNTVEPALETTSIKQLVTIL